MPAHQLTIGCCRQVWFWLWVAIICVVIPLPGCCAGCCYEYRGKRSPPEPPSGYVWSFQDERYILLKLADVEPTAKVKGEVVKPK